LPAGLKISTITMSCNIGTTIKIRNVAKYMILDPNNVVSVKYNIKKPDKRVLRKVRTLLPVKKKKRKTKVAKGATSKKKQDVVNQVSLEILHGCKGPANIKLFTNGAIHITGVQDLRDFKYLIKTVINALNKKVFKLKTTYDTRKGLLKIKNTMREKKFYNHKKKIKIKDLKINMINSGFRIEDNVDRIELYKILRSEKVECQFDPNAHAGVRIKIGCKYKGEKKKTSIFVFESGKIMITGAYNNKHLHAAYDFIVNKLTQHHDKVTLMKIDDLEEVINKIRKQKQNEKDTSLHNKKIVISGFRDKKLKDWIVYNGGKLTSNISKSTDILVIDKK